MLGKRIMYIIAMQAVKSAADRLLFIIAHHLGIKCMTALQDQCSQKFRSFCKKFEKVLTKQKRCGIILSVEYRGVAQLGRVLGSGPRGRAFESRHSDHKKSELTVRTFLILTNLFKENFMANVGIICEYNPFHPGHAEQLAMIDHELPNEGNTKIALMSGNFVQRGEPAIYHKYLRANAALASGVDLVLEYPFPYSMGPAKEFAYNAVTVFDRLGTVDYICFGSECGDLGALSYAADVILSDAFEKELSMLVLSEKSVSYAALRMMAFEKLTGRQLPSDANDILALEYLCALKRLGSIIRPIVIKRQSSFSASGARKSILLGENDRFVLGEPTFELSEHEKAITLDDFSKTVIPYLRQSDPSVLVSYADVTYDLACSMIYASRTSRTLSELVDTLSSKSYPRSRIKRAIFFAFFRVTKEMLHTPPTSVRLLGANTRGRDFLRNTNGDIEILSTTHSDKQRFSLMCDEIYSLVCDLPVDFYKQKPIIL